MTSMVRRWIVAGEPGKRRSVARPGAVTHKEKSFSEVGGVVHVHAGAQANRVG